MRIDTPAYLIVQQREDSSVRLISETANDGARAVFVFSEPVAAEAFLILENLVGDLGPGWEVIEHTLPEAARLLEACASEGVGYVVLNPPTALTRGADEPALIPIRRFVDYLLDE